MKMKRIILLLSTLVLLIAISMNASAYFYSGNDLIKFIRAYEKDTTGLSMSDTANMDYIYFTGYIIGCVDALPQDKYYTLPDNVTVGQICAIFVKYMNNHPEQWNLSASGLYRTH